MTNTGSENRLYFDIETTGLSPASSHITVIGTAFSDASGTHVKQFVCLKPTDEKKILREFASYIGGFDTLVHYNGRSFDIPYVTAKCRFYQIRNTLYDMHETDLYRTARRFSFLTGLGQTKQKDVEKLAGFKRTDTLSGADCIRAYMDHICSGSREALDKLLLHNREDLEGMVCISEYLEMLGSVAEGRFSLIGFSDEGEASCSELGIRIEAEKPFKVPVSASYEPAGTGRGIPFAFTAEGKLAVFSLKAYSGELRYYFEDYKDYYFLPEEGRAVHKSIGQFVDPAFREKAKKETAFEPVTAVFYPQCGSVIRPQFKSSPDDKTGYFRLEDIKDPDDLKRLIMEAFSEASK